MHYNKLCNAGDVFLLRGEPRPWERGVANDSPAVRRSLDTREMKHLHSALLIETG